MFSADAGQWAEDTFAHADLGDTRRTKRLVKIASSLANHTGQSLVQSLQSPADIEAAYRFIRNQAIDARAIDARAIADAGFAATAKRAKDYKCLLALEDTTSLEFIHRTVHEEMGHLTSNKYHRGIHAHSVLLFSLQEQHIVGLIEQERWTRDINNYGQRVKRTARTYKEKESYKWEQSSRAMANRLGNDMQKVISVCDRESDLIEYLTYKTSHQQRFIVRSARSRCIEQSSDRLYQYSQSMQAAGKRVVQIKQRGRRKAREADCEIRYARVTIKVPANKQGVPISLYYVCCQEVNNEHGICWHILTTEPVRSEEDAQFILDCYEKRWLIEEFHNAWKTGGTCVENLRMQSKHNLEKMVVILALIAVRLHQLRYLGLNTEVAEEQSCEIILSPAAWKLLWLRQEKTKPPKKPPSVYWAYISLGKLVGWHDSKRNGRIGWKRLWEGWFKLQTLLEGYYLAKPLRL